MKPLSEREKEEDEAEFNKITERLSTFLNKIVKSLSVLIRRTIKKPFDFLNKHFYNHVKNTRFITIVQILNLFYLFVHVALPFISALGVKILLNQIQIYAQQTPLLFESVSNRIVCMVAVVVLGFLLYLLRENYRFFYASLELGAGAATAYNAVTRLFFNHDTGSAMVTLLGAMYIVVRAFDNYSKHYEAKRKTSAQGVVSL